MPSTTPDVVAPTPSPATPPRMPAPVLAVAGLSVVEALGLLAVGLTGLDGVLGTAIRPSGWLVAGTLLVLASWVVACAGGGASLLDGAGRGLLVGVAGAEIALVVVLFAAGLAGAQVGGVPAGVPLPALALLALAVPTGKLLLAGAPSASAWLAAGGRPRPPRPAPGAQHRVLRGITVACIGLVLAGVAVVGAPADPVAPSTAAVTDAP
ncbi:hypothetical protein [Modestobacter sp. I12A-02662]|uniref:hypothetical protein n=1 Tax=Modestobacter sp. I12A-02662 TaxID=1730496 RepID=UPI0034DEEFE1